MISKRKKKQYRFDSVAAAEEVLMEKPKKIDAVSHLRPLDQQLLEIHEKKTIGISFQM